MKIKVHGYEFPVKTFKFPAGEVNVNILNNSLASMQTLSKDSIFNIETTIRNSDDIMELLLVKDAINRLLLQRSISPRVELTLLYLPYARQDRVCNKGEAFSLKVFANLINSQNFDKVYLYDVHSSVGTALINNSVEIPQEKIIQLSPELSNKLRSGDYVIVIPDAGAEKKAHRVAQHFGCDTINATKRRDLSTGRIEEIKIVDEIPEGKNFLIVDDICDGGGTFIPLAGELSNTGKTIDLYITHGIFSKGTEILSNNFETVYTTNSFYEGQTSEEIEVIQL